MKYKLDNHENFITPVRETIPGEALSPTQKLIVRLRGVKESSNLTVPQIEVMVNKSISSATLYRFFEDGSETKYQFTQYTLDTLMTALLVEDTRGDSIAIEKVGGFDNRIIYGEDIDLWYRLMLEFPCAYEDMVLSYYRIDAENRACEHTFPLKIHIPYYIDKYAKYRAANKDFRRFFDEQCLYRLYPYAVSGEYIDELKHCLAPIDWSLQKKSMRFLFPKIYNWYRNLRGRGERNLEQYTGGMME